MAGQLAAAGGWLARALRAHRRLRIALLCTLLALPLLGGGWLWLRDSSLVAVRQVRISGVHGPGAGAIEAALEGAARRMSTLDVRAGALRAAVAPFRIVRQVSASASFPHGLSIRVVEQLPVAAVVAGSERTAVTADGIALGPALLSQSLPEVHAASLPPAGQSVRGGLLLGALAVLGAAPAQLAHLTTRAYEGPRGLTVALHGGLLAYFGDSSRAHAKWLSLARVLADPSSAGASYVDVRLPERPAAGFPPGTAPPGGSASASGSGEQPTTTESTAEALAAGLGGAAGSPAAGPAAGAGAGHEEAAGQGAAEAAPGGAAASEASSPGASESHAGGEAEGGAEAPSAGG